MVYIVQLTILGSSSSGNSALVEVLDKKILIDAGFSFRRLSNMLQEQANCTPEQIDAVLVTHEHSDHIVGLSGFATLGTPVYATGGTIAAVSTKKKVNWRKVPQNAAFDIEGICIESFGIPHDAMEPIGFSIQAFSQQLTWALDMGYLNDAAKTHLTRAQIIVLESNYDEKLLQAAKRPFSLKQRIKGRHGHLSNDEAFEFLTQTASPSWQQVYLAHLSNECNDPQALQSRYASTNINVEIIDPKGVKQIA